MHLNEIISIVSTRLTRLQAERNDAVAQGWLNRVEELDKEIAETHLTLLKLQGIESADTVH